MTEQDADRSIHILDPATVNKIAAGEVIERPASAVKELVENSIDADASIIRVDIASSGGTIQSIRVTDDGCGIGISDAELAFAPHATSKIVSLDDLFSILTLGFRGEALASIAAIAKVTLISKPRGNSTAAGFRIVVSGGKTISKGETGSPVGTSVLVEDLFFNTPARKKFQKSLTAEIARIHTIIEALSLSHPQISFRFFHNNREQIFTERTTRMIDTITRIFGSGYSADLIPVSVDSPIRITGYISRLDLARKDRDRIFVSVNGRYVTSPLIIAAIREGYSTLLPRGRYPAAFLALSLDTRLVDINVHPAKKEVRLSREKEIREAVKNAVQTALFQHNLIPEGHISGQSHQQGTGARPIESLSDRVAEPIVRYLPETSLNLGNNILTEPGGPKPLFFKQTHAGTRANDYRLRQTELASGVAPVTAVIPPMEIIGQFGGIYILATTPAGELIIIDQHAAHERIFYEQVSRSRSSPQSQELIVPAIVQRTSKESLILRTLIPYLAKEGLIIEEFGNDTFLVRAVPAVMGESEGMGIIDDLVNDLVNPDVERPVSDRERIIRIIACRSAIKAGTVCTQEQCQRIVDQLRTTGTPFTCPHGRPTMIRFSREKLDEMFHRT